MTAITTMMLRPTTKERLIVLIYALCFIGGALSHGRDFLVHGLRPYQAAPFAIEAFWSSLIFIDLLIAGILLAQRVRLGVALALITMSADVAINTFATIALGFSFLVGPLVLQSIFLGFILGTCSYVLGKQGPGA